MVSLLVAAAEKNEIGKNNQLLWHLPNDMKFFKNTTWGMVVKMGRKTFESMGKPLAGRMNIVITTQRQIALKMQLKKQKKPAIKKFLLLAAGKFINSP